MTRRALAVTALVPLLLAGCGTVTENLAEEAAERAAEAGGGGDVEVDVDDEGNVSVESDEGSISVGSGASLPDGFPESMPVPEGLETAGGFSQEADGRSTIGAQFVGTGDRAAQEELAAFYESQLEANGWTIVSSSNNEVSGSVTDVFEVENGELTGSVAISLLGPDESEPQLSVLISLESVA